MTTSGRIHNAAQLKPAINPPRCKQRGITDSGFTPMTAGGNYPRGKPQEIEPSRLQFNFRAFIVILLFALPRGAMASNAPVVPGYGNIQDRTVKGSNVLIYDSEIEHALNEICAKLSLASGGNLPTPRCLIINRTDPNAYATSGNFIFITSGLLNQARSKCELAGCIAHEMAHRLNGDAYGSLQKERDAIAKGNVMKGIIYTGAVGIGFATGGALATAVPSYAAGTSVASAIGVSNALMVGSYTSLSIGLGTGPAERLYLITFFDMTRGYSIEVEELAESKVVHLMRLGGYEPACYLQFLERLNATLESANSPMAGLPATTLSIRKKIEITRREISKK